MLQVTTVQTNGDNRNHHRVINLRLFGNKSVLRSYYHHHHHYPHLPKRSLIN